MDGHGSAGRPARRRRLLVFVAGVGLLQATVGTGSSDPFHQIGLVGGIGNGVVVVLYAFLLYRERAEAR